MFELVTVSVRKSMRVTKKKRKNTRNLKTKPFSIKWTKNIYIFITENDLIDVVETPKKVYLKWRRIVASDSERKMSVLNAWFKVLREQTKNKK